MNNGIAIKQQSNVKESASTLNICHNSGGQMLTTRQNEMFFTAWLFKSMQPHRPSGCTTKPFIESGSQVS
ncbi:hypothetical protein T07_3025 [Trichinella nelsoni]|uniref:Uncharacterized protein n=1 Tax=Trichinella nelsoni TaxID=6336 RepID=A0A0V0SNM9_9BILA|nr:hypothetical protein T07_3025 [Trichinella nelsoni]